MTSRRSFPRRVGAGQLMLIVVASSGCAFDPSSGLLSMDAGTDDVDASTSGNTDSDNDGWVNNNDNCPTTPNADQYDEDQDQVGDACDNCPTVPNQDQRNTGDGDSVGDACDPRPSEGGDTIALFDGFNGAVADPRWKVGLGGSSWNISNGQLHQSSFTPAGNSANILYWSGQQFGDLLVETSAEVKTLAPSAIPTSTARTLGVVTAYDPADDSGYSCIVHRNAKDGATQNLYIGEANGLALFGDSGYLPWDLESGGTYEVWGYADDPATRQLCAARRDGGEFLELETNDTQYSGGFVGLRTYLLSASFNYVIAYDLGGRATEIPEP